MMESVTLRILDALLGRSRAVICTMGLRAEDRFAICGMVSAIARWRRVPLERTVWS